MIAKLSFTVHLFKFLWLTENVKHFEAQMQMVRLHVFLIVNSSHYNSWNFTISNLHFHLKYQLKCEISGNSSISAKSSKWIFFCKEKKNENWWISHWVILLSPSVTWTSFSTCPCNETLEFNWTMDHMMSSILPRKWNHSHSVSILPDPSKRAPPKSKSPVLLKVPYRFSNKSFPLRRVSNITLLVLVVTVPV